MRTIRTISAILFAFLLSAPFAQGQTTWEHFNATWNNQVLESSSGNVVGLGNYPYTVNNDQAARFSKFDFQGNLIWEDTMVSPLPTFHKMALLREDLFVIQEFIIPFASNEMYRFDALGNVVDTVQLNFDPTVAIHSFFLDNSSNLVFTGYNTAGSSFDPFIAILDTNGVVLLDTSYAFPDQIERVTSTATSDGNYLLAIKPNAPATGITLQKVDPTGNVLWVRQYHAGVFAGEISEPEEGPNGRLYLALTTSDYGLMAFNAQGDSLWTYSSWYGYCGEIDVNAKGNILMGRSYAAGNAFTYLAEVDSSGNLNWENYNFSSPPYELLRDARYASNGGILIAGDGYISKRDSLGDLIRNVVSGTVFQDLNANCIPENGEATLPYWVVRALPSNQIAVTDLNGRYEMLLDSGSHTLELIQPANGAWSLTCPPTGQIPLNFSGWNDTVPTADFGLESAGNCPLLRVELATPFVRNCDNTPHYINYYNMGSQQVNNPYVELTLDTLLTFFNATLPAVPLGGNRYRFDLPPIPVGGTGNFTVYADVACPAVLGESVCSEARIFPDSSCIPPDPNWSGASIEVEGVCLPGDTVEFTFRNSTNNAMLSPVPIWIAEDDILRLQSTVQLGPLQSSSFKFSADGGGSFACFADQVSFHPGNSLPRAFVEACGRDVNGDFSKGFVAAVMQDELDYAHSVDCQEVIGSWDPNDKQGFPLGLGVFNEILDTDALDYRIRFQNTGTDTAFKVILEDVLPAELDASTFQMGTSSHPYSLAVLPGNVLEWTFDPIELPDSNVNEPESHGFVTFRIGLQPGLAPGTQIRNKASIFFDYNLPVITNEARHMLGMAWEDLYLVSIEKEAEQPRLQVYPNPASQWIRFAPESPVPGGLKLEVYDLAGRLRHAMQSNSGELLELDGSRLPRGAYLFRLEGGNGKSYSGKFILR